MLKTIAKALNIDTVELREMGVTAAIPLSCGAAAYVALIVFNLVFG